MPIYTKKGDKGRTSLRTKKKVWKDNVRVEAYGTLDELNSYLGVVKAEMEESRKFQYLKDIIESLQNDFFFLGSYLANPGEKRDLEILKKKTLNFERQIDFMTDKMPKLANFILPGGGKVGAGFQFVRTLARRAERRLVSLARREKVEREILVYINRLSDLFFTMSRFANFLEKKKESIWRLNG